MSPSDADVAVIQRRIAASPATVFSFLSSTEGWLTWQGTEAVIEAWPGGIFRVNVRGDGFISGTFLEVVPDRRVVFTWGWEGPDPPFPVEPGGSRVEIDLVADGDGTILRLTHSFPDMPEIASIAEHGWTHYLERLTLVSEGGEAGPDPYQVTAPA